MIGAKLIEAAGNGISTVAVAEAIDFDGTNDYLSRSSLVGNSDGKQFTCSAFFYIDPEVNDYKTVIAVNFRIQFRINLDGGWYFTCKNAAGVNVLDVYRSGSETYLPVRTWVHFLISIDLTDNTKRSIYVNDILMTGQIWGAYTNDNIAWTYGTFFVGANSTGLADPMDGRLSNVYLDYTYRDLSVEANRRLFVTADLKPAADQATLNPILYLPMDDPTAPGANAGTGGNFTLNGTVARSGRGPNQYNAPYSTLTTGDYLSRTTVPTGIADSKQFTLSFSMMLDSVTEEYVMAFGSSTTNRFRVQAAGNLGQQLMLEGWNASGTQILFAAANLSSSANKLVVGRNYMVTISLDLADTAKRFIYINGESKPVTWITYTNDLINFNIATSPVYRIGQNLATTQFDGKLGALWFNTSYIDLSVPANLAKFVTGTGIDAKPVDLGASGELPTGTSPLIYLPMYGNNAGKNYGTGGDFTVNSGPYTGARGPNEFWGNKASGFNGSSNIYLTKATSLSGVPSSGSTLSIVCWFNLTNYTSNRTIFGTNSAGTMTLQVISSGNLFMWLDSSGYVQFSQVVPTGSWVCLMFSKTGSTYTVYVNDTVHTVDVANSFNRGNSVTYTNTPVNIATRYDGISAGEKWYGSLSEFYFTTGYIDFSQEANRLKFRDAFGNPVDLTQQIEDGAIPNPAIYMRFPPTSFGTNSGTGGNFTVNGTITDGGQL